MSELNLDKIRANADWYRANREGRKEAVEACPWAAAAINSAEDVPALLVEVERLRAETARLCADLADDLAGDRTAMWRGTRPSGVSPLDASLDFPLDEHWPDGRHDDDPNLTIQQRLDQIAALEAIPVIRKE